MLRRLGKFEILKTLGRGAMGEVYLAHHPAIGRDVAIKTILPSAANASDAEDRFRREASAAGTLNHPNIVTIYDFDRDGELLYLVMEYVKGEDLEVILKERSMSSFLLLEVLAQICDGLDYAHRNGVIHRDIKPANIRVSRDGERVQVKVMDFGIARLLDSELTGAGIVMGTVSYMAPEYIRLGHASTQGDLWAVGVMLFESLAGLRPFGGDNTTTILFKIVSEEPPPINSDAIRGISPSIQNVLNCALSKDPAQRFKTAEEFAKSLRACQDPAWRDGLLPTATVPAIAQDSGATSRLNTASLPPLPPAPVRPTQSSGGPKGLVAFLGVGLLALISLGAYYISGKRSVPPGTTHAGTSKAGPTGGSVPNPTVRLAPGAEPPSLKDDRPAPPAPASLTSAPVAGTEPAQSVPALLATPAAGPKDSKPKRAVPVPVEETSTGKLSRAVDLLSSDPSRAAGQLRNLAAAEPGDAPIQGNLLAALYRLKNPRDFDRALDMARSNGLSGAQMMKAAPAFRLAMVDELRAHKAKDNSNVLPATTVMKIVN